MLCNEFRKGFNVVAEETAKELNSLKSAPNGVGKERIDTFVRKKIGFYF